MKNMHFAPVKYRFFATKSVAISVGLVATLLLAACSKPAPAPEPIRAVKVFTVSISGLQAGYEYAGEVRARVESRLGFRVAGKIIKRQAEVGQRVKAGQLLAQLDPQDYKLAVEGARAQVAAAATNRDLAAADFKRFQSLKEQNFISGAELERRETTLKASQAQLTQAQAQLANVGNQVDYANLVANVSGIITAVESEVGQVVTAGTPVVRIAQDGPRDVVFSVPENKLASVAVGSVARAKRWSGDAVTGDELNGKIRELAASADPLTRTYQAKLAIDATAQIPLGSTVYVFPSNQLVGVPVIKLPTSALMQSAQGSSQVWLLDKASMTVNPSNVQVASADGNEVVISAGLKAGDMVVSAGVQVLSPGLKVSVFQDKGVQEKVGLAPVNIEKSATKSVASAQTTTSTK